MASVFRGLLVVHRVTRFIDGVNGVEVVVRVADTAQALISLRDVVVKSCLRESRFDQFGNLGKTELKNSHTIVSAPTKPPNWLRRS